MEVFIESPTYIRLKAEDQPRENVHSKILPLYHAEASCACFFRGNIHWIVKYLIHIIL